MVRKGGGVGVCYTNIGFGVCDTNIVYEVLKGDNITISSGHHSRV